MSFAQACRKVSTLFQGIAIVSPATLGPHSRHTLINGGALQIADSFKANTTILSAECSKNSSYSFLAFRSGLWQGQFAPLAAKRTSVRKLSISSKIINNLIAKASPEANSEEETMAESSLDVNVGFIGAGQMAEAMARGFSKAGVVPASQQFATDPSEARREVFSSFGVTALQSNVEVAEKSDVIFLAVKPYVVKKVLEELQTTLTERHLIVSIAAGVTLEQLQAAAGKGARIVRVMPNTPCLVGETAAALSLGKHATEADGELVQKLFSAVGLVHVVPENLLDAVTGLSGSGPAYIFIAIEALADGGVAAGLPRDIALSLAAQTVKGAAEMVLQTGKHPGVLKDSVASPGGTTIAGLHELEKGGVRSTLINAVLAAAQRSKELSK
ncbi:pyrroline-5-carboxylate reductase [Klebsormidium nitens]|uniref:Pyrroline-5-carboxylate reductase n=1 Tax=Klebsormidium nitens TaxID=105231 RepID=A0A1Y1HSV0_KLENI|nr:pyrroline-5-carboxylate reductase [Klebsormidium nitens]|eukprot:GAQ80892.1 pyrroline-5-carboxylate reductase [Klebsormidium nitens]